MKTRGTIFLMLAMSILAAGCDSLPSFSGSEGTSQTDDAFLQAELPSQDDVDAEAAQIRPEDADRELARLEAELEADAADLDP